MGIFTFIIPHIENLGLETRLDIKSDGMNPRVIEVMTFMLGQPIGFVPDMYKPDVLKHVKELNYGIAPTYINGPQLN